MATETPFGVHSEVGTLRKVMVCAPGRAHERLTPSNCDSLLFDDVLWVQNAKRDHFDFMTKMRERGIEVVEMHDLLAQTLDNPEAKNWLLDRQITANEVGLGLVEDTRAYLESLDSLRSPRPCSAASRRTSCRQIRIQVPRYGARGDRDHGVPAAAAAEHASSPAIRPAGSMAASP